MASKLLAGNCAMKLYLIMTFAILILKQTHLSLVNILAFHRASVNYSHRHASDEMSLFFIVAGLLWPCTRLTDIKCVCLALVLVILIQNKYALLSIFFL